MTREFIRNNQDCGYDKFDGFIDCDNCTCKFRLQADVYISFQNKEVGYTLEKEERKECLQKQLRRLFYLRPLGEYYKDKIKYLISKIRELKKNKDFIISNSSY